MDTTLTRRERERLMRRQAMLDAAQAVFAEKGYTQATLDEVAQRAEFGKGTLYNYFEGGKEEILFAIFDQLYDDLVRVVKASFADEPNRPFREVFSGFVATCFVFFDERKEQFMILVKEAQRMIFSEDREKAVYFHRQRDRLVDALVPPLEAAIQAGYIRPFPVQLVAHMIFGNINGYQMHVCLEESHGDGTCHAPVSASSVEAAAFLTTMLLDGLMEPQTPATPAQP